MKRKVISQGSNSYTITLPVKWVRAHGLCGGHEVEVQHKDSGLVIEPSPSGTVKFSSTQIDLQEDSRTLIRAKLANTYRAGYDSIKVGVSDSSQTVHVKRSAKDFMMGFSVTQTSEQSLLLESMAEPSSCDHEKMIEKMFHMISLAFDVTCEALNKNEDRLDQIDEISHGILTHDNHCRRVMCKESHTDKKAGFYWVFLPTLNRVGRDLFFLHKAIKDLGIKANHEDVKLAMESRELFRTLKDSYMKRSTDMLANVHEMEKKIIHEQGYEMLNQNKGNGVIIHHLLSAVRNAYLASSPLYGILNSK